MKTIKLCGLAALVILGISTESAVAAAAAAPSAGGNPLTASQGSGVGALTNPGVSNLQREAIRKAEAAERALRAISSLEESLVGLKASVQKKEVNAKQLMDSLDVDKLVMEMKTPDPKAFHDPAKAFLNEHKAALKKLVGLGAKGEGSLQASDRSVQELRGYAKDLKEASKEVSSKATVAKTSAERDNGADKALAPKAAPYVPQLQLTEIFDARPRVKHCGSFALRFDPGKITQREIGGESPGPGESVQAHPNSSPVPSLEGVAVPTVNTVADDGEVGP